MNWINDRRDAGKCRQSITRTMVLLCLALYALCLFPSNSLANKFTIFAESLPPYNLTGEDHFVYGISADTLIILLNRCGVPARHEDIRLEPWGRGMKQTEKGPNTILISMARTPSREKRFKWVGPVGEISIGVIARKSRGLHLRTADDLKPYTIGAIRGSAPHALFIKAFAQETNRIMDITEGQQLFQMLIQNRLDMAVYSDVPASNVLRQLGENPDNFEMIRRLKRIGLYIALSPDVEDTLVNAMQRELKKMKTLRPDGGSEFKDIQRHYEDMLSEVLKVAN